MKIGIIGDAPVIQHSVAVVCGQLAKQLVLLGHEVSYLGYGYSGEKIWHPDGYFIHQDTVPPTRRQSVSKFIEDTGVEILFASGSKDVFSEGMIAAKQRGIPYLAHTFYSTPHKTDVATVFEARSGFQLYDLNHTDEFLALNKFSVGVGFALGKRCWHLQNGVDTSIFNSQAVSCRQYMDISPDDFVVLFSGSNMMGKNPISAIGIFAEFAKDKNDVWLAMHTRPQSPYSNLKEVVSRNGLDGKVKFFTDYFPEWLEQPDADKDYMKTGCSPPYTCTPYNLMPGVFATGDVALFTTLCEGQSTSMIEALAVGLPIICSDDAVISEIVNHGTTGFLCRQLPDHSLVTEDAVGYLNRLYNDRKLLGEMSVNAESYARICHDWSKIALRLEQIMKNSIEKYYD